MYSGVGGQMDFIRGAALADEGRRDHRPAGDDRATAALAIVPELRQGAGVVTTRAHVETSSPSTA